MINSVLNQFGFALIRRRVLDQANIDNIPRQTLLGLGARPIRTVIDVGANTGQFAKRISNFFPESIIYCFEPLPEPFNELSTWAKTQRGRVIPFNLAIGDEEGEAEMFLHEDYTPSSSLLATTELNEQYYPFIKNQRRIAVKQTTLNTALRVVKADLASEILIKLDVQGYEDRVIAGGGEVFKTATICLLEIGVDSLYEGQADFFKLNTMLDSLGYRYVGNLDQTYREDGHVIYLDAVFLNKFKI
jgi:FkbM family methyltransferase